MFIDREDAARQLVELLRGWKLHDPLVLAIPRGGIIPGAALAQSLRADLDVVLSRKLRAPHQPELAIGAVAEDGRVYLDRDIQAATGASDDYLEAERRHQLEEIARRRRLFRAVRPAAPMRGRSIIVTDDGIATGSTMLAALDTINAQHAREVIVAVPVAPPDRLELVCERCDRLVYLLAPPDFVAVGQYYRSFDTVEDADVVRILRDFAPVLKE
jgi:predicted phosphoribosyltransferase